MFVYIGMGLQILILFDGLKVVTIIYFEARINLMASGHPSNLAAGPFDMFPLCFEHVL